MVADIVSEQVAGMRRNPQAPKSRLIATLMVAVADLAAA
jgi:hypothetical protein